MVSVWCKASVTPSPPRYPHGVAFAAIAALALRFGLDAASERYSELVRALSLAGPADYAIDEIKGLAMEVGRPTTVEAIGVIDDLVDTLVAKTLADAVTRNAPRIPAPAELTVLLRESLCAGWLPAGRGVPGL
ncbi:iron-containing alcohol dehydrogenase [Nocardia terpenica]|uniref:iron-containing alcohol dehydrogenase n=1 Tax=Nocardia terpenica TaxID=455432 RepID=UPI002FDFB133